MIIIKRDAKDLVLTVTVSWLSAAGGAASVSLTECYGYNLAAVQTVPGTDGDLTNNLPTADYDVVINDEYGEDIMKTELANRSGTVAKTEYANPPFPVPSEITIEVTNAGAAKEGIVNIFLHRIG